MRIHAQICFGILLQMSSPLTFADGKLFGELGENSVRLRWPAIIINEYGVDIGRRREGKQWVILNSRPIIPEINPAQNLEHVESDTTEAKKAAAFLATVIKNVKIYRPMSPGELRKKMQDDNSFTYTVGGHVGNKFPLALALGFGLVDRGLDVKHAEEYQYGLFYRTQAGRPETPAATFTPLVIADGDPRLKFDLVCIVLDGDKLQLQVRYKRAWSELLSVNQVRFFRKTGGKFVQLGKSYVNRAEGDYHVWNWYDAGSSNELHAFKATLANGLNTQFTEATLEYKPQ